MINSAIISLLIAGIVDRPEESDMVGRTDSERLKNLQSIQVYLLRYALFNFPKAKKIVYSTCSVHPEENEEVIDEVLADIGDAYRLVPVKQLLPTWTNFSSEQYHCGDRCLYARSNIDFCNGFFVAMFERNFDVPIPECTRKGGNAYSVETDSVKKRDNEAKEVSHQKKRGKNKNTEELLTTGKVRDESVPQTGNQAVNEAKSNKRRKKLQETDACSSTNLNHEKIPSSKSENIQTEDMESKKSKKKRKSKDKDVPEIRENNEIMEVNKDMENEPMKKKKKKKKDNKEDEKLYVTQKEQDETESLTKKKKKKQIKDAIYIDNSEENKEYEEKNGKKKKQKKKAKDVNQGQIEEELVELQKNKKRKNKTIESEDPTLESKRLNLDF